MCSFWEELDLYPLVFIPHSQRTSVAVSAACPSRVLTWRTRGPPEVTLLTLSESMSIFKISKGLSPLSSFGGTVRKRPKVFPRIPLPEIPLVSLLEYGRLGFQGPIDVVAKSEEVIRRWKLQEWDKNSLEFETWRSFDMSIG